MVEDRDRKEREKRRESSEKKGKRKSPDFVFFPHNPRLDVTAFPHLDGLTRKARHADSAHILPDAFC